MRVGEFLCRAAVFTVPLAAQHGSSTTVNPYTKPEDAASGATIYRQQCAGCHGPDGTGTGAGPAINSGRFARGSSDEALFATITKGVPGTAMSAFNTSGLQTWQLVTHLRTMSFAGRNSKALSGNPAAGSAVFRKQCLGCHRIGTEGGFTGPELAGVGSRKSVLELRESILHPSDNVAPEYWRVNIRTSKGQTITGTRLNEDTYSIQIRGPQGRLQSFLRSEIGQVEWVRTSPMPTLQLSAEEIDNLLAYVSALPGSEQ